MTTSLYTHPSVHRHDTSPGHPERIARIEAVDKALAGDSFSALRRCEPAPATLESLGAVHDDRYLDRTLSLIPDSDYARLDPDTVVSSGSGEAALHAAGAVIAAVDDVIKGETVNAFCAVRPPGHHAESSRSMGFCLFNNVAVGAQHARHVHGLKRIAIIDFDVHHGNGTQAMFQDDPDTFFASSHQYPFYPGTGAASETGVGNIVNVPLESGAGSTEFRTAMETRILPALRDFAPHMVMISAGFDAHARDPLASLNFEERDFEWATRKLMEVAAEFAESRLVSTLEGGYNLEALGNCVQAHVAALMSADHDVPSGSVGPSRAPTTR